MSDTTFETHLPHEREPNAKRAYTLVSYYYGLLTDTKLDGVEDQRAAMIGLLLTDVRLYCMSEGLNWVDVVGQTLPGDLMVALREPAIEQSIAVASIGDADNTDDPETLEDEVYPGWPE